MVILNIFISEAINKISFSFSSIMESCIFCDTTLEYTPEVYDTHAHTHADAKYHPLILTLMVITDDERQDIVEKYKHKVDEFKGKFDESLLAETSSDDETHDDSSSADNTIDEIQNHLEYDSDSDEENEILDENNFDETDVIGISDTEDGEQQPQNNSMTMIKIENIKSENEPTPEEDDETANDEEDSIDLPQPTNPNINKINLAAKFKELGQCRLCYIKCASEDAMKRHEDIVHKNDQQELMMTCFTLDDLKYTCEGCPGVRFLTENILIVHTKLQHGKTMKPSEVECCVCKIKVKRTSLKGHLNSHREPRFRCPLCYNPFKKNVYLQEHISKVHSQEAEFLSRDITDEDKVHPCESSECDLKFVSQHCGKIHYRRAHADTSKPASTPIEKRFKCFFCDEWFTYPLDRQNHCLSVHNKKDEVVSATKAKCMVCDKIVRIQQLTQHKSTHLALRVECKLCYVSVKKKSLCDHFKNMHQSNVEKEFLKTGAGDFNISCQSCDKKFMTETSLSHHKLKLHQQEKKEKMQTNRIKNIKTKIKKVSCFFCDERFVSSQSRMDHCWTVHGKKEEIIDENHVRCMVCSEVVKTGETLRNHRKIHVKKVHKMDITCKLCQSVFYKRKLYLRHLVSVHKSKGRVSRRKQCNLCYKEVNYVKGHKLKVHQAEKEFLGREITEDDLKYPCNKCEYKFVSEALLKSHMKQHDELEILKTTCYDKETSKYQCCLCYKDFQTFSNIASHIHFHKDEMDLLKNPPEERDQSCPECDLKFPTENSVFVHRLLEHYQVNDTTCTLCDFTFKTIQGAQIHRLNIHNKELELFKTEDLRSFNEICKKCGTVCQTSGSFRWHMRKYHNIQHRETKSKSLKQKVSRKSLLLRQSSIPTKIKTCRLCYIKVKKPNVHMMKVHTDNSQWFKKSITQDDLKFNCSKCEHKFVSSSLLRYHEARHGMSIKCFFCPLILEGHENLTEHCLIVHDKKDEDVGDGFVKCMVCDKKIVKGRLNAHRLAHGSSDQFKCSLCYQEMKHRSSLWAHNENIHKSAEEQYLIKNGTETDLKFDCSDCDLKFYTENLLNYHKSRQHNYKEVQVVGKEVRSVPTLTCNLCYTNFANQRNLKDHKERVHTTDEEKALFGVEEIKHSLLKVECSFCDKKLINQNCLKFHRQYSHKEEMKRDDNSEISCEYCGRVFKWKNRGNLKIHMKNIHKVDDYDVAESTLNQPSSTNTVTNFMSFFNSL